MYWLPTFRLTSQRLQRSCFSRHRTCPLIILVLAVIGIGLINPVRGQEDFEKAPILYSETSTHDPVARLQAELDSGETQLEFDEEHGYLKSVLELLGIRPSSQVLVHSKTSFQLRRISPRRPRALYFNDHSYVGWVQGGDVVEVMTTDPLQGEVFYTLAQQREKQPKFVRDRGQCLSCHASSRTQGVPGGLVRSVFVDATGQPHFGSGTFNIDHRSPFKDRWGGWYVTGTHGEMRHMGNVISKSRDNPEDLDRESGANLQDLSRKLNASAYLTPHSDIVALIVLEHQTQMQNYLTRASYEARRTSHYDAVMNDALERPKDFVSDLTKRRIATVGDELVKYLLFAEEFQLTSPVEGTSTFAKDFQSQGPHDSQGRSLRQFDLQTRMFKYPCSYLIYSPSFDRLPKPVKQYVATKLKDVLTGKDESGQFAHLSEEDRSAILDILMETKPRLWSQ